MFSKSKLSVNVKPKEEFKIETSEFPELVKCVHKDEIIENVYKDKVNKVQEESFENNLLEYPQYTKPQKWEKKGPPEVLLSGDHAKIKDWRLSQSEAITRDRRPDLWKKHNKKN